MRVPGTMQAVLLAFIVEVAAKEDPDYKPSLNFRPNNVTLSILDNWVGSYYNGTTNVELSFYTGLGSNWSFHCPNLVNTTVTKRYDSTVLALTEPNTYNVGYDPVNAFFTMWPNNFNFSTLPGPSWDGLQEDASLKFAVFLSDNALPILQVIILHNRRKEEHWVKESILGPRDQFSRRLLPWLKQLFCAIAPENGAIMTDELQASTLLQLLEVLPDEALVDLLASHCPDCQLHDRWNHNILYALAHRPTAQALQLLKARNLLPQLDLNATDDYGWGPPARCGHPRLQRGRDLSSRARCRPPAAKRPIRDPSQARRDERRHPDHRNPRPLGEQPYRGSSSGLHGTARNSSADPPGDGVGVGIAALSLASIG
ncbi:hypothetical protein BO85DRAFT_514015 [Aspergillus piperis CBS 112811]|uniref:Uncharacterized protein n=1 Tax=Aspergillus piperis CBS 112811 TaxID=1448313 RepID=A0A8G1R146_9EURO|nr:hypothetical protein BO85DRAFT_514015 [Aspergillus piperis CBS 112811]RAH57318.1 hypothetical protein BO85DRAFT_514015 [Aspergillus piperis CBS 112811]